MTSTDAAAPGSMAWELAQAWTLFELHDAQRSKRRLRTIYPGMAGVIIEVRSKDSIVMKLDFGALAYVQTSALCEAPPTRFKPGVRVKSVFGKGVVTEARMSEEKIDYVVSLIDCILADKKPAIGYIGHESLQLRPGSQLSFAEVIEDSTASRNRGNEQLKVKNYAAAAAEYRASVDVLGHVGSDLDKTQQLALIEALLTALSNTAHVLVSQPEPDYKEAVRTASEALNIESRFSEKLPALRYKLLYRRALAFMGLKEYKDAVKDLKDPCLVGNEQAKEKLKLCQALILKEKEKEQAFWNKALTAKEEEEGEVAGGSSKTATTTPTTPTGKKSTTTTTTTTTNTPSTPSSSASSSPFASLARGAATTATTPSSSSTTTAPSSVSKSVFSPGVPAPPTRLSIRELREQVAKEGEEEGEGGGASSSDVKKGLGSGSNDITLEQQQEAENTSGGWGNYLLYGGIGLGALALGAYALSKSRR